MLTGGACGARAGVRAFAACGPYVVQPLETLAAPGKQVHLWTATCTDSHRGDGACARKGRTRDTLRRATTGDRTRAGGA
eukprot:1205029-Prymnesium_polylepis.1